MPGTKYFTNINSFNMYDNPMICDLYFSLFEQTKAQRSNLCKVA